MLFFFILQRILLFFFLLLIPIDFLFIRRIKILENISFSALIELLSASKSKKYKEILGLFYFIILFQRRNILPH